MDEATAINFTICSGAPLIHPTTLWHVVNMASPWRWMQQSRLGGWSIVCPCDCQVVPW